MSTNVIITANGLQKLNSAIANSEILEINKFSLGDSFDYTPTTSQEDILGNEVFNQDSVGSEGASISLIKVGDYSYEVSLFIDGSVGNFDIGEYSLKLDDGTTFAIGVLSSLANKVKGTALVSGNAIRLRAVVSLGNAGDTLTLDNIQTLFNSVSAVADVDALPSPLNNASPNIYHIRDYRGKGTALAVKDLGSNSWKFYVQPVVSAENEIMVGNLSESEIIGSGILISNTDDYTTSPDTEVPTKTSVSDKIELRLAALVDSSPAALDTLNELAAALGDDENFSTTVTNSITANADAIAVVENDLASKVDAPPLVGAVMSFAHSIVPTGWLECNGASLSRTTYADLFGKLGTSYGNIDGNTFNLPDLRGEFIRGWDNGRGVDGSRVFGSNQSWAIENIVGNLGSSRQYSAATTGAFQSAYPGGSTTGTGSVANSVVSIDFNASRVVNTSTETRPRNTALMYCIKY